MLAVITISGITFVRAPTPKLETLRNRYRVLLFGKPKMVFAIVTNHRDSLPHVHSLQDLYPLCYFPRSHILLHQMVSAFL